MTGFLHSTKREAIATVAVRVVRSMGADEQTGAMVEAKIHQILNAIDQEAIGAGTILVPWNGGSESSIAGAVSSNLTQLLRLGHDDQIRGEIWMITASEGAVSAGQIEGAIDDYSNHELMRLQAELTDESIRKLDEANQMIEGLLGKASNFQEPKAPGPLTSK